MIFDVEDCSFCGPSAQARYLNWHRHVGHVLRSLFVRSTVGHVRCCRIKAFVRPGQIKHGEPSSHAHGSQAIHMKETICMHNSSFLKLKHIRPCNVSGRFHLVGLTWFCFSAATLTALPMIAIQCLRLTKFVTQIHWLTISTF